MQHHCDDLVSLFDRCFAVDFNTRLVGGNPEPEYLPADVNNSAHRILFTRDYFRSALHETAHWCVAGADRRLLPDFGYWYAPDGRTADQQRVFEQAEVKPQALEWIFCAATGHRFDVSTDNLSGEATDPEPFRACTGVGVSGCWLSRAPPALRFSLVGFLSAWYATECAAGYLSDCTGAACIESYQRLLQSLTRQ